MNYEQLLQAMSDMMDQKLDEKLDKKLDEKLKPIYIRLDKIEDRLDAIELRQDKTERKLNDFYLEFKTFENNITRSVHALQDEMGTVIEIIKLNELVP